MKVTAAFLACLVQSALSNVLYQRSACNHDNCYRAVAGTSSGIKPSLSVRQSDCSSFMQTTVTPAPTTTTIYVTATPVKRDIDAALAARQATTAPTAVPTYASFCSGTERYSSACSCFGFTAMTSYAPTPTATVTSTVQASQCTNPGTCGSYQNCGTNDECFCGYDTDNNSICFQSEACDSSLACSSNADCVGKPNNATSCLLNNCCGFNICSPTDVCPNPASKTKLFKARANGKRDGGCTSTDSSGCP